MTALLIFLWLLAGAVCSFLFLLTIHKCSPYFIDDDDKAIAFLIFIFFPLGVAAGLIFFVAKTLNFVVDFIEEKF